MQKLLSLFTLTLAFLSGLKSHAAELSTALDTATGLASDLKAKLDASNSDHAALLQRADAAEARAAELETAAAQLDGKAQELAAAINEHPATPTVDPETLAVTAPAPDAAPASVESEGGAAQ